MWVLFRASLLPSPACDSICGDRLTGSEREKWESVCGRSPSVPNTEVQMADRITHLELTLRPGRRIRVGQTWVSLRRDWDGGQVHLCFEGPESVEIMREEVQNRSGPPQLP